MHSHAVSVLRVGEQHNTRRDRTGLKGVGILVTMAEQKQQRGLITHVDIIVLGPSGRGYSASKLTLELCVDTRG